VVQVIHGIDLTRKILWTVVVRASLTPGAKRMIVVGYDKLHGDLKMAKFLRKARLLPRNPKEKVAGLDQLEYLPRLCLNVKLLHHHLEALLLQRYLMMRLSFSLNALLLRRNQREGLRARVTFENAILLDRHLVVKVPLVYAILLDRQHVGMLHQTLNPG
jgi:hypothetical protein